MENNDRFDPEAFRLLMEMPYVMRDHKPFIITYMDRRGNVFDNEFQAIESDDEFAREDYYNHLLQKRNWVQRFFNIKPSMKFYDEMSFKAKCAAWKRK